MSATVAETQPEVDSNQQEQPEENDPNDTGDEDYIPVNKKQFMMNLKKFLVLVQDKVMVEYAKINISEDNTICIDGVKKYMGMIKITTQHDIAKLKQSWGPEHHELFKELYEEYEYDIIEDPPTLMWLSMSSPKKLAFGSTAYAQERYENGDKPFNMDKTPVLYLSKIIDCAQKVSEHYIKLTEDVPDTIKKNTPQIRYHGLCLLYLYNIIYNNCTSKDRKKQLLKIIRDMEVTLGLRQKASTGGGLGDLLGGLAGGKDGEGGGGGIIGNVLNAVGPAIKGVLEGNEGKSPGEAIKDVLASDGLKDAFGMINQAINQENPEGESIDVGGLVGNLVGGLGLGKESNERLAEFAADVTGGNSRQPQQPSRPAASIQGESFVPG